MNILFFRFFILVIGVRKVIFCSILIYINLTRVLRIMINSDRGILLLQLLNFFLRV